MQPVSGGGPLLIQAGIDEAGLGPLLGPLALGWSAIETRTPSQDAWDALAPLVLREVPRSKKIEGSKLVVADSKKVHSRNPRGRSRLERTALEFAAQLQPGGAPPRLGAALLAPPFATLGPSPEHRIAPWYDELDGELELHTGHDALELGAERLRRTLEAGGIKLLDAGLRLVPALELNRSYQRTNSKGITMLETTFSALDRLWRLFGGRGLSVVVDRQGGRAHYGPPLARAFPTASVSLVEERPGTSSYVLEGRAGSPAEGYHMEVSFTERGEEHSFTTALGSCFAKFGREAAMAAFNRWWCARSPGLKPTAGYTTDGRRWLEDAREAIEREGLAGAGLTRDR
ncbi:MAG: hypothetical protein P1V81_11675 [Planctomycetota bacterium]|nr:hypothetical protein [Planctomycetota bacterium]